MSLLNPVQAPYPATATGLDRVIINLQAALDTIPWITAPLLRAWNLPESREEGPYRNPRIYSGGKDYWNVMFNDDQTATSFCVGMGPAVPAEALEPMQIPINWNKRLDVIIHGNLKKIDAGKDYVFTEELVEQVLLAFSTVPSVVYGGIWTEDIRDVFEGFDLSEIERDHLYYPHFAMRFELEAGYRVDTGSPSTGIIC